MRPVTLLLCLTAPVLAQDGPDPHAKTARLFAASCVDCHLPPDPAFPVDRAWITQLADTA